VEIGGVVTIPPIVPGGRHSRKKSLNFGLVAATLNW
jgi:hypothetical protein